MEIVIAFRSNYRFHSLAHLIIISDSFLLQIIPHLVMCLNLKLFGHRPVWKL